jgi:hypothetical protein
VAKYIVGQTYTVLLSGGIHTFEVLEEDDGIYGIRWDDGCEEWAYEADLDNWIGAAL